MFDSALFYSKVPETLEKLHKLLEAHIKSFSEFGDAEADMLKKYRQKRSMTLKKVISEGTPATVAGDIVKGECAEEKSEHMKALVRKQQCQKSIDATQDKIYTVRHLSGQVEHQKSTK